MIKIAFVDDDQSQHFLIKHRLSEYNKGPNMDVSICYFEDPAEFLARIAKEGNPYDVVVLDARMGQTTGPEVLAKMRELHSADCVILFFTGLISEDETRTCLVSKSASDPIEAFVECFDQLKNNHVDNLIRLSIRSAELKRRM